jgi:hypothetical protein
MGWQQDFEDEMTVARRGLVIGAKDRMGEFIAAMGPWDLFGGLTFDQRRCRHERVWGMAGGRIPCRIPIDSAKMRFQSYVRAAERRLGRRVEYVAALESHRNGWPHLHPLLRLEGGLLAGDIEALGGLWYRRQGYGRLEVPRSAQDVTEYCAKYLSKDLGSGDLLLKLGPYVGPSEGA